MHVCMFVTISILHVASCKPPQPGSTPLPCRGTQDYQKTITLADFGHVNLHIHKDKDKNLTECEISIVITGPPQFLIFEVPGRMKGLCKYLWIYEDKSESPICSDTHVIIKTYHLRFLVNYPNKARDRNLVITSVYEASLACAETRDDPVECCYEEDEYKKLKDYNELAVCDTNRCISRDLLCDGLSNCDDKTDETGWHLCLIWPGVAGVAAGGFVVVVIMVGVIAIVVRRVIKERRAKAQRRTMREMQAPPAW